MSRIPLYYTFGNHMHWVDMEWLWGYHVLPGSIRDMLRFCAETGAKGNVNFDGVGYEKLAAEDPEALAELKAAIQAGTIEPVGCSYGQPYGLFHGGESNVRQRIYGVRTVLRLFGVRPRTFWEEEFDFFPQLPQMLAGAGFQYASLFFQWTWHTPEIPREEAPVIWWEGQDGSRLLCATRNKLNLHQWPEDMDITFASLASEGKGEGPVPLILQWLELMPSPDWMCRSEVLLPKMKELLADNRFEIKMTTLGEYLKGRSMGVPPMVSTDVPSVSEEVEKRQGANLPHWTREGGTYAITFRLNDALPKQVREEYAEERETLRKLHESGKLTSTALSYEYLRLYSEKVEKKLDEGYGSCLLRDPACGQIVAEALKHFDGERYQLHGWCVMPNHVHAVLTPLGDNSLDKILHSWKSFTAHKINEKLDREGTLWQTEYYDHLIRNADDLRRQLAYIESNPSSAGLGNWEWVWVDSSDHDRDGHGNHGRDAHATPVRRYGMDDVWHGMTLGKNGDAMRRKSQEAEYTLLAAETLAAINGLAGRPYAQWDVYPTWELEEIWRVLLQAQHHDNDECEGLCGHVGASQYRQALEDGLGLQNRQIEHLASGFEKEGKIILVYNPLGWARRWHVVPRQDEMTVVDVPACGWTAVPEATPSVDCGEWTVEGRTATFVRDQLKIVLDLDRVTVTHFSNSAFPEGLPIGPNGLWEWVGTDSDGDPFAVKGRTKAWHSDKEHPDLVGNYTLRLAAEFEGFDEPGFTVGFSAPPHHEGLEVSIYGTIPRPKGGMNEAFGWRINFGPELAKIRADQPYGVSDLNPTGKFLKKYPEGDWMTSPQWFEEIERPFTGNSFVDLHGDTRGLQIAFGGCRQWFAEGDGVIRHILHAYDPWDENRDRGFLDNALFFLPHAAKSPSELWRQAQEFVRDCPEEPVGEPNDERLRTFSALSCDAPNVVPTAFYRETEDYSGKRLDTYAGKGMGYPYVVRLVEFDGKETEATLTIAGTVAKAYKTNLLGEIESEIPAGTKLSLKLRPYEIATLYLDIEEGRKQSRDLDAKRGIWATVHRVE